MSYRVILPKPVEKQLNNLLLRWDSPALQNTAKMEQSARVFGRIRGMKDRF